MGKKSFLLFCLGAAFVVCLVGCSAVQPLLQSLFGSQNDLPALSQTPTVLEGFWGFLDMDGSWSERTTYTFNGNTYTVKVSVHDGPYPGYSDKRSGRFSLSEQTADGRLGVITFWEMSDSYVETKTGDDGVKAGKTVQYEIKESDELLSCGPARATLVFSDLESREYDRMCSL